MFEEDIIKHMAKLKKEMDKTFEEFFERPKMLALPTMGKQLAKFREPLSDIVVKKNEVVAKVEMPGIDKKDVVLNVMPKHFEIKAQKRAETKEEKKGYFKQERSYQGFYRSIPLPVVVNPEAVETNFANGVLEIKMPRAELTEKKKTARIK